MNEKYIERLNKYFDENNIPKMLIGIILLFLYTYWLETIQSIHVVTDFLFKGYYWYRKRRNVLCARIMPISYGDHRNHVTDKWLITNSKTPHDFYMNEMNVNNVNRDKYLLDKYFILEVWLKEEKFDVVEHFRINENKFKKYSRDNTIDELLNDK